MRIGGRGSDPFWGLDPFRYIEPEKLVWEKPKKSAATDEDNALFFGNAMKVSKPLLSEDTVFKRVNFKV